ncbi:MAG: hypothetical protein R3222_05620 [Balneolaceae bacterium]|nr:hypothetical protein [Balneolaceae bacterium]
MRLPTPLLRQGFVEQAVILSKREVPTPIFGLVELGRNLPSREGLDSYGEKILLSRLPSPVSRLPSPASCYLFYLETPIIEKNLN